MAVLQQLSDLDKKKHGLSYGHRWSVEIVLSSIRRMFGGACHSYQLEEYLHMRAHMYSMFMKISPLNRFCTSIIKYYLVIQHKHC